MLLKDVGRLLICFSICFFPYSDKSHSQKLNFDNLYIEQALNAGMVIKNYPTFPETGISQLYEFNLGWQTTGTHFYEEFYRYPDVGLKFTTGGFGNEMVLGKVFCLMPEIGFYSSKPRKIIYFSRLGLGAAYFNKPFHLITNPENILIGSRLTAAAFGSVGIEFKWVKNLFLNFSISSYHFSNSHYQLPNVGLNVVGLRGGLKYYPNERKKKPISNSNLAGLDRAIHYNVKLSLGINEYGGTLGPTGGPKYPIYSGSFFLTKHYSYINKVALGIDASYNTGAYDFIINNEIYYKNQKSKSSTAILFLAHEFLISHLSLYTQAGYYIHNPLDRKMIRLENDTSLSSNLKTKIAAKLGVQYYLRDAHKNTKNQFFIGAYVKTNLGQADYFEVGAGYTFK